ncbi:hypothetical protein DERP_012639 [Dermatophagoides pteronyssinus]|uniref:Interference hedgehog-like n=1 Tax=Dermatophagoides pteronyssinus TaxID=6956 RepID=A0ABQ8IYF2_DERPT|nr:hypothetical protein DERP_012639 [Dermatophagoides pteronyssinus]
MFTCIIFISTLATTINIDDNGGSDNGKHNHHDDQRLQFIIEPETIWAIADGRKISFRCQVLPADARIRWLLNGTIITDNDNNNNDNNGGSYGDWIKISENKLSIKLQKTLTNSDSLDMIESQPQRLQNSLNLQGAVFQCLAEWNNQVIVSQPAKLIIAELMPFDDQQQSKQSSITNITAIQGNNIIIPCNLPHSIPIAIAEFEFNQNQTITSNNLNQDRYRILPSGQLLIQNVRQFDSGKYRCIAHNPFLQEKMYSSNFIQLKVLKPKHSTNDQKQLRFLLKPKIQMTVIIGSNITFECVVHGFPVPKITWTKIGGGGNDDHLPRLRSFQSNGILIITTVQKNDEGIYSCTASNSKSTIETNTELKVYEMPEIIQDDYEQFELEPGQNMDLYCESRGQPKPLISWLHNGYFIDSQITNDVFFDQNGSILKIIDANPKLHQGIYQCFATNELGTTYAIKVIQFKSLTNYHHHHNHHHDDQQVSNSNHHHHRFTDSSHLSENSHQHSNIDSNNNNNNGYSNEHTDFIDNQYRSNDNDDDNDNGEIDHHHSPHHHNHNHHHNHHNNDKNQHQHHPHGKKKPGKSGKDLKLIPPSRPEISKLNDDSVMVRWMVPKTTGLPIQFFKVQYKELGRGDWNTVDVDIPAHIFAYPVCCLNPNSTYRFRIAAVYSNDDNKNGKSSNKFIFRKDPQLKRPTNPPTILNATSISSEEIIVEWEHLNIDQQPVDGFFINYRATDSAGQYLMVTSIGRDSRRQNIQHLKPNTAYEIKMQCFNDAGTSDFSNIYTVKTQQQQSSSKELDPKFDDKSILPPKINNEINDKNDNDDYIFGLIIRPKWLIPPNRDWLAIAIIIITMVLFILACSIICCLRQKSSSSSMNGNNSTGTDGTKLKLESSSSSSTTSNNNNNNHHYFNAINGLIQEQNRRLSTKTSATSNGLTNGNNHHAASGLMMLKSIESQLNHHHVNNKNHHSSTNEATTTTDSAMMNNNNNNDLSCSSSSTTTTTQPPPQMPITLSMNRRNSFHRNSLGLLNYSSSQHHLYSSNNDQQQQQQHNMDNQNHVEQQQQQQQIATIDRKRSLKNSISGSYLDPLSNNTPSPSISSSNNNNGGLINRMNQNHHHSSFTRLNGTLERKRRSRHDLSQTTILNNGNGGSGHFYNSRSNINHNGSTMDMFHSSNNHRQQQYSTGNNQTNNNYFHSHHSNSGNSAGGSNNFVIMQSSC